MEFALQAPVTPYDPQKAKQLLAEAGFPNGIDAGDFTPNPPFFTAAEARRTIWARSGIRTKMRQMERAAFLTAWREKKLRGLFMAAVGNSGNAASRVEAFMYSKGSSATAATPTSTTCSTSRRASGTRPGARPCCTRSSSSRSTA